MNFRLHDSNPQCSKVKPEAIAHILESFQGRRV